MISAQKTNALLAKMDLSGFIGEWVATEGSYVIAHSKDLKSLHSKLTGVSLRNVLFTKVPGNETMIMCAAFAVTSLSGWNGQHPPARPCRIKTMRFRKGMKMVI